MPSLIRLIYFLYDHFPGCHPSWSLAVLAISQADADSYVRAYNRGGKRAGVVLSGKVDASCGAVSNEAQKVLSSRLPD